MVEDLDVVMTTEEECLMVAVGKAIEDSGCTAPVMGSNTWDAWLGMLQDKGMSEHVVEQASHKTFKFGDGRVLKATKSVTFPVSVFGLSDRVTAHIVPGDTPFLLSKGLLVKWGVVQDFRNAKVSFIDRDREWYDVEQNDKGHFVFDLLDGVEKFYGEALYLDTVYEGPEKLETTIIIPEEILKRHLVPRACEDLGSVRGRRELL